MKVSEKIQMIRNSTNNWLGHFKNVSFIKENKKNRELSYSRKALQLNLILNLWLAPESENTTPTKIWLSEYMLDNVVNIKFLSCEKVAIENNFLGGGRHMLHISYHLSM